MDLGEGALGASATPKIKKKKKNFMVLNVLYITL
jgi:hypothetical protein